MKDGRLKRESSFGPKAVSLARSAATAFASLRDKPGFTVNSVASCMPEIASLLVGGGIRTPQPAFLQLHLKADVKDDPKGLLMKSRQFHYFHVSMWYLLTGHR